MPETLQYNPEVEFVPETRLLEIQNEIDRLYDEEEAALRQPGQEARIEEIKQQMAKLYAEQRHLQSKIKPSKR